MNQDIINITTFYECSVIIVLGIVLEEISSVGVLSTKITGGKAEIEVLPEFGSCKERILSHISTVLYIGLLINTGKRSRRKTDPEYRFQIRRVNITPVNGIGLKRQLIVFTVRVQKRICNSIVIIPSWYTISRITRGCSVISSSYNETPLTCRKVIHKTKVTKFCSRSFSINIVTQIEILRLRILIIKAERKLTFI